MWDTYLYITLMGVSTYAYTMNYRVLTPPLRTLTINITITCVVTLYAIYILIVKHEYNIYIYHILIIIQYALYAWLFSQVFDQSMVKRIIWTSIGLFGIVSLKISLTIQPWDQFNSYGGTLFNLLISLLSGYYLWRIFVDIKVRALEREAMFWVSVGLFFRSLGSFFVYGLMNYLLKNSTSHAIAVYGIHEFMECVLFGFFLLALYVYIRYLPDSHRH